MKAVVSRPVHGYEHIQLRYKKNKYPVPNDPNLPRMFFVGLFVGSRGSGKTFSVVELLKQYERHGIEDDGVKVAQRVVVFSPTHDANPVFNALRHLDADVDVVNNYSDQRLLAVVADVARQREETREYQLKLALYRKFLRVKRIDELEPAELMQLELNDFEPPQPPKYPHGCVTFFVLDDLVGSDAFKSTGKSALTNLVLKNRHLGINILICTQNLRAIPKSIRTNTSLFVVFRFASMRIITEDLYEEVSNVVTLPEFEALYDAATAGDHGSLVIDFSAPKEARFKRGWDTVLSLQ